MVTSTRSHFSIGVLALALVGMLSAQETRSMIFGWVLDPSRAAVANAEVIVTNEDTNTSVRLRSNDTGYYEAPLLIPGNYRLEVETGGFKKALRRGITLSIATRAQVDVALALGSVSESLTVTAEAPLLETNAVSTGMVIDKRTLQDLPTLNNNPMLLTRLVPGIQTTGGAAGYTNPAFTFVGSSFSIAGNVGGNDFSIDGVPNQGNIRRISYSPHTDTVQEFKVETSNFDASTGHSSGAGFTVMTKSGTNQFRGSASLQHWRNEWNAAGFFAKQTYFRNIAAAEARGDSATANTLRTRDINPPGHSNNYSGTFGGPVILPKLYNGRDKMFFFVSYSGLKDRVAASTVYYNRTVPTLPERQGDLSDLLRVDPVRYQIYDPLTTRQDPARPGHVVRDPFPGNIIPRARMVNPLAAFYSKIFPIPNNNPADPSLEPAINYRATGIPWRFDYEAYTGRWDYQHSSKHRFFGRTQYWTNFEANQDWLYESAPRMGELSGLRTGVGTGFDWVFVPTGATVLNVSLGYQYFSDAIDDNPVRKIKPSAVGLPGYVDGFAGAAYTLPTVSFSGYDAIGRNWFGNPNRHGNIFAKADYSRVLGKHTLRAGFNQAQLFKTTFGFGTAGLNTSGNFDFNNFFTRRDDDGFTPAGSLGHSWAAYLLGIPSSMSISAYDSGALHNAQYGWYAQDSWRLTSKLTVNLGLRMEYELAPTERFDRAIGAFDPAARLPITDLAQAAYARNPLREVPAASFSVLGGSDYVGANGTTRRFWANELMFLPRVAAAYQIDAHTVLRAGYGLYFDSLNVRDFSYTFPNQFGFNRATSTTLSNDFGVTFLAGDPGHGVSPLADPFPLRADGTRFNQPVRNALGLMAVAGRGFSYFPSEVPRARQQRWRVGVQRQFGANILVDIGYAGSYSDRNYLSRTLQPLPAQYWADGMVRNNAVATDLNSNVSNPFYISNFGSLAGSLPLVYQDMSTNGFFTSPTIRKNQLLRAFPHLNGLSNGYSPDGRARTDALEARLEKRFARGFNLNVTYTGTRGRAADFFYDEFDLQPTERENSQTRPHRITMTTVAELPFGRGKRWANTGVWRQLFGGFQVSGTYEYQAGGLLSFGNLFYYGNLEDIRKGSQTPDRWFNTDNFERNSLRVPAAFHRRVFPVHIDGLRAASTNLWNANVQREFLFAERARLQLRFDVLNLFNHTTFSGPDTNPLSSNFGKVTNQTGALNRYIQIQAKVRF